MITVDLNYIVQNYPSITYNDLVNGIYNNSYQGFFNSTQYNLMFPYTSTDQGDAILGVVLELNYNQIS